jgi:hypothetical protein
MESARIALFFALIAYGLLELWMVWSSRPGARPFISAVVLFKYAFLLKTQWFADALPRFLQLGMPSAADAIALNWLIPIVGLLLLCWGLMLMRGAKRSKVEDNPNSSMWDEYAEQRRRGVVPPVVNPSPKRNTLSG